MAISTSLVLKFDGAAVQRGLASIKKSFAKVGDAIKKIGIGIGAFAVTAAAGLAAAAIKINAIGESAAAGDKRLQNITKQMGIFGDKSDEVTDRLLEFADAQERLTGVDTVVATQAKLMTFAELAKTADKAGGAFDRATMAAVDMAKAGFGTAEGNAVQLGKALNDPVKGINALSKSGISFTDTEKEKIATLAKSNMSFEQLEKSFSKANVAHQKLEKDLKIATMRLREMTWAGNASDSSMLSQKDKVESLSESFRKSTDKQNGFISAMAKAKSGTSDQSGMLQAQEMILKAIETQLKATAKETATSSEKITQSFNQIVEAFAIPFSEGFNELPAALESVFPLLKAKAEEAGGFVSDAISEAIAKDTTKLEAIGVLIADVIGAAMVSTFEIAAAKMMQGVSKLIFGELGGLVTGRTRQEKDEFNDFVDQMTRGKVSGSIKSGTSEAMERYRQAIATQSPLGREREQQAQVSAMQQAGKTFATAGMPQAQRTPGTSPDILSAISSIPDMVRQTIVELKNVNRSLAPTP